MPLNRRADYLPGVTGLAAIGVHYTGWKGITPQLQFNLRLAAKDSGFNSDRDNSGGQLLYASPGGAVRLSPRASLFAFIQVPVYQRVNGFQLTPRVTATAGLQVRL